ncbi:MAG: ferredoxin reductase family protein [Candidatus Ranarchaeia archaeon]|jgi:predicted ferric reductase
METWRGHNFLGYLMILVLVGIPLGLIGIYLPIIYSFANFTTIMTAGAKITAFSGLVLFAVDVLLSTRIPFLDHLFGGLDKVYHIHHYTGLLAFIFLVLHPLFLAARLLTISVTASLVFFLPVWDVWIDLGKLSLLLMTGILLITLYIRLKYQTSKRIHQLFGIPFFLGGTHALLSGSVIAAIPVLRIYILGLVGLTVVSWIHTTLLGNPLLAKGIYQVGEVNRVHPEITEISLIPLKDPIQFIPGQFILIRFDQLGLEESHPFSITSSNTQPILGIAVKALGDFTTALADLKSQVTATIEGPYGGFSHLHTHSKSQVWIAGGIGITPFLSMARTLRDTKDVSYHIDLYYSCKRKEDAIFMDELQKIEVDIPNLRIICVLTDDEGYLTAERIAKTSSPVHEKDILLCGPKPMMDSLRKQFVRFGIPSNRIHSEEFKLLR